MIEQKVFSIIIKKLFILIRLIPVKNIVKEIKKETNPIDWKNRSDVQLPLKPNKFFIDAFSVNIKFGSSGE